MKNILKFCGIVLLFLVVVFDVMFLTELKKTEGNPVRAAVRYA